MQLLQTYGRSRPLRHFPLSKLAYEIGGRHHEIIAQQGKLPELRVDGARQELSSAILPSKVIALSMTPFDKFPIGSQSRQLDLFHADAENVYSYHGMRDRMGRASVSALLFRAVENLISRHDHYDRARIAKVFDLVGYKPNLEIVFRIDSGTTLRAIIDGTASGLTRSRRLVIGPTSDEGPNAQKEERDERLRSAAATAMKRAERGFVVLPLNVQQPSAESISAFFELQLLRQNGLARLYAVEAEKSNGDLIDLKQASSGELSISISFMSLASNLQDDSLILIDEPETNLHPEWQSRYIDLLSSTFAGFRGCHYVLATHSPLILADAPPSATLSSVSDDVPLDGRSVSGMPVDYLLVKAFQTVGGNNYYLQEEVIKALRLAADGLTSEVEFQDTIKELSSIKSMIQDNPGIVEIISSLESIAARGARF